MNLFKALSSFHHESSSKILLSPATCIIFDDMPISKTQIGIIKNVLSQKIIIFKAKKDDSDHQNFWN